MSRRFEELDWQNTEMGEISLRRRLERTLEVDVYEVKLGEEFLMSSLFTVAEIELARLGLAACAGAELDVVVGGLGLGYTAVTALEEPRVRSLVVVEALGPVIGWHEKHLLPDAETLTGDPRTRLVQGDFFALAAARRWVRGGRPGPRARRAARHRPHPAARAAPQPRGVLHARGAARPARPPAPRRGLRAVVRRPARRRLREPAGAEFGSAEAHVVSFANPLTGGTSANTVYVAVD